MKGKNGNNERENIQCSILTKHFTDPLKTQ